MPFRQFGLSPEILRAVHEMHYTIPTPIQEKAIPDVLQGKDLLGSAQTGTGKTAAFGLPLIERLREGEKYVQALIMVPTRELALQVSEEINSLKGEKRLRISAVYGGQSIEEQLRRLRSGIDIVVGTPGRIIDHLHRGSLKLNRLSYLVLDEADEMLDMGFIEDIEEILTHVNQDKRMMLFGATMPDRILGLVKKFMKKYERFVIKKDQLTTNLVDQIYFEVSNSGKFETLCRIVDIEESFYGLVFCRTKADVDDIAHKLLERGYSAEATVDTILRRMPDYVKYVTPQFSRTHINFQRVATVDTSNPFVSRDIPTLDESFVVIRFRSPKNIDFPYLLDMIHDSFMSRSNTIVVPGGKMSLAMEVILAPIMHELIENKKK